MLEAALLYAKHGSYVFPAPPGEKKSYKSKKFSGGRNWGATRDEKEIDRDFKHWPEANIGLPTGIKNGFFAVEADTLEGHQVDGIASLRALEAKHGKLPDTRMVISPSGSEHYYFKYPTDCTIRNSASEIAPGVDVRGEGGMVLAPPSIKPGVGAYRWLKQLPIVAAPDWLIELCKLDETSHTPGEQSDVDPGEIAVALAVLPNADLGWEEWNRIGMAIYRATEGNDQGFWAFDLWSHKSTKYNKANTHDSWYERYRSCPPTKIGVGTIFYLTDLASPGWRVIYQAEQFERIYRESAAADEAAAKAAANDTAPEPKPDKPDPPDENEIAPAFSEHALALLFAQDHCGELRYVAAWGKWLIYDGIKWKFDDTRKAWTFAGKVCLRAARQTNKPSVAKQIASAKTRAAVINIAGDDRRIAATVDQWDTDTWLLNTPGGVVDLRTGKMRPHRPEDYMTKSTAVTPDAKCPTPRWKAFLKTTTDNNIELENYIRRALGYSLTGLTIEQVLFFLYGQGQNGKGVLMTTAARIVADYHRTATLETFIVTANERHSTDVAGLRGARLVTVSETEEGKRWAESKIKEMTGGDKITARFMRQDNFDFYPEFKLWISGNHRPKLSSVTVAIRRRMNMLPFTVIIPEKQRDRDLTEKLKAEWPGILAWMIDGCLEWQRVGLQPPQIVTEATNSYLETEDTFGRWIAECFDRDVNGWLGSTELFQSWQPWAAANNEYVGSQKRLSTMMDEHGFVKKRDKKGDREGFLGLKFKYAAPVTLTMHLRHENNEGVLVEKVFSDLGPVWLQKAVITIVRKGGVNVEITIPGLLAKEKGLLDEDDPGERF